MKMINKTTLILTSITTLMLLTSVNTHAKIYKWTDANGQTHYSAQPPAPSKQKIKAEDIEDKIRANAGKYRPPSKTASKDSKTDTDADSESNSDDELAGPDKKLIKYCDSQRNNLKQLKKNFRNIWIDVKGNKTSLTQEQRKEKVSTLEGQIKENCSDVKPS